MKSDHIPVAMIIIVATMLMTRHSLAFSPSFVTSQRLHTISLQAKHAQKEPAHHEKWQPFFDRLLHYQSEHDGDLSDINDGELADWLEEQRKQYHLLKQGKKVRLTKKRAMALERAGAIPTDTTEQNSSSKRATP
jgi:hypothetical protein